ncbi:hypothetical protein SDC9_141513 [bioreactor metagenome]|uniref:Uncharacterized protein n=1 Tax=bioreactor metagenome TaxID=1076179 RepID=A0A645DYB0_9ZZZZ
MFGGAVFSLAQLCYAFEHAAYRIGAREHLYLLIGAALAYRRMAAYALELLYDGFNGHARAQSHGYEAARRFRLAWAATGPAEVCKNLTDTVVVIIVNRDI